MTGFLLILLSFSCDVSFLRLRRCNTEAPRSWGKIFTAPIWTIRFKVHKRGFELLKNTPLPASVHIINTVKN